ncbi:MAG: acylphosphatase [Brachybacterium sp.]|nr:acylphosphatase [Brachybacterium sp.]
MSEHTDPVRRVVTVSGRVQGVGFRMAAQSEAERIGVGGTARNLLDGRVEVAIEGTEADVSEMVEWLRSGPSSARVTHVDVRPEDPRGADAFRVTG